MLDDQMFMGKTESAVDAIKASPLQALIASVKEEKQRAKQAKVAEACLDIYTKSVEKQEKMAESYREQKEALELKLSELKTLTAANKTFEDTCNPFPMLEAMGIDKVKFCKENGIKE